MYDLRIMSIEYGNKYQIKRKKIYKMALILKRLKILIIYL